ncbi:HAMP domain-containing sensor histidine kinase [Alsobacter sp. KACC 23698]|uniref:histidine kinase n=1 Tax=Alsobacter sp. KACC 23698 TaxID=3149229 RepID=A0AAU7JGM5_9HYPH
MRRGSLKLRLLAAGVASVLLALTVAGIGLLILFERHVERRMALELAADLRILVSGIGRDPAGALEVNGPPLDPRYGEPLSGRYWQIAPEPPGAVLRSRSLWDAALDLPPDALADGQTHEHLASGPGGQSLLVTERSVVLPVRLGGGRVRAAVALDRSEIHAAGRAFASDLAPSLVLLAAVLVLASWVQVAVGLRPLDAVRFRLAAVRTGAARRLGADFPDEVRPLAAEVDHLLAAQATALERARGRAADLAHGFRTPLTVLAADAEELRGRGEIALAQEIAEITEGLRRHVERELARACAGVERREGQPQPLGPWIERVTSVLRRTPAGKALSWTVDASELSVRVDEQDLTEMIGNLAENACKWAVSVVRMTAVKEYNAVVLRVEDDGPGIPPGQAAAAMKRGGRLDERQAGSGLGLAIVQDLAEAYGASFALRRSDLGGLSAEIRFPEQAAGLAL